VGAGIAQLLPADGPTGAVLGVDNLLFINGVLMGASLLVLTGTTCRALWQWKTLHKAVSRAGEGGRLERVF